MSTAPTDTELALLAAICARPADDTPRLVYADWLLENAGSMPCPQCKGRHVVREKMMAGRHHRDLREVDLGDQPCHHCDMSGAVPDGRAERAEFIRVQCELARLSEKLSHYHWRGKDKCKRCHKDALRRREREVLERHEDAWTPDPLKKIIPVGVGGRLRFPHEWARGFVSTLTCSWSQWHGRACERCRGQGALFQNRTGNRIVQPEDMEPCPACPGPGRLPGIGRHLHWHPGATDECPECKGTCRVNDGSLTYYDGVRAWKTKPCQHCTKGRVPRPIPAAAQPVTRVRLTDDGRGGIGSDHRDSVSIWADWETGRDHASHTAYPGISFELPTTMASFRNQNPYHMIHGTPT